MDTEAKKLPCINPQCRGVLGTTTVTELYPGSGGCSIRGRVVLYCVQCGRARQWKPRRGNPLASPRDAG